MDVNHTPYFLFREADDFRSADAGLLWDADRKALVMAQSQTLRLPAPVAADVRVAWEASLPLILDRHGQVATLDGDRIVMSDGEQLRTLRDAELNPLMAPAGDFVDLAVGGDGLLAAPFSNRGNTHGVLLFKLGARWQTEARIPRMPRRAIVDSDDLVWCISRDQLFLLTGRPLPQEYTPEPAEFAPCVENPREFAMAWQQALPPGHRALALAADDYHLYLLTRDAADRQFLLRRDRNVIRGRPLRILPLPAIGVPFAMDLGVVAPGRLALPSLVTREAPDCGIVQVTQDTATKVNERYPMLGQAAPRLVSCLDRKLRFHGVHDGPTARPRHLKSVPKPQYPGRVDALLERSLNGGGADTLWHRVYLDACIPPGCSIEVSVHAYNEPDGEPLLAQARPLRSPLVSELPFFASHEQADLYEVLLQRPEGNVRRITGRTLEIALTLRSDGKHSPALYAMRVYHPRFSYQEAYLPEYLRQEEVYDKAGEPEANGADVRERLLAAFEGILTPLEGRVAEAEKFFHPQTAPPALLNNVATALGARLPSAWPTERKRDQLAATGLMQMTHGTLAGVRLALDVASDGGVGRGEVVVVENFRLRRTMATLIGIDMDDADHPLTLGTQMSGNSIVGDSLILSDDDARTFLALFSPDLADADEREAVQTFFDEYSHQVSVLLHAGSAQYRSSIEETLAHEMPAHVQWRLIATEHPFVLGLAPLLALDSYLEAPLIPRRVTLGDTYLGREGLLLNHQAFSPSAVNAARSP